MCMRKSDRDNEMFAWYRESATPSQIDIMECDRNGEKRK